LSTGLVPHIIEAPIMAGAKPTLALSQIWTACDTTRAILGLKSGTFAQRPRRRGLSQFWTRLILGRSGLLRLPFPRKIEVILNRGRGRGAGMGRSSKATWRSWTARRDSGDRAQDSMQNRWSFKMTELCSESSYYPASEGQAMLEIIITRTASTQLRPIF